jgi:hypothetical protein
MTTINFATCTAAELRAHNLRHVVETARPEVIGAADARIRVAVETLGWQSAAYPRAPPLYIDVCDVKRSDVLLGAPDSEFDKPVTSSEYVCGIPAYVVDRLESRGFHTCVARDGKQRVIRVSMVPLCQ